MAVGLFVAFTPTMGIQMIIAGFLSWLCRANKVVSVAMVWISNPATMLPIYWYCYRIGIIVLAQEPVGKSWWGELASPPDGWWPAVKFYWSRLLEIAGPLWLGGCLAGVTLGYATYYTAFHLITIYRRRKAARKSAAAEPVSELEQH